MIVVSFMAMILHLLEFSIAIVLPKVRETAMFSPEGSGF